ncbi:MAG: hypothetical protein QOD35_1136, partial [Nocardioidaceae bacterium]|nr:hypothetical protein [Nocardioidaceae bacterium]
MRKRLGSRSALKPWAAGVAVSLLLPLGPALVASGAHSGGTEVSYAVGSAHRRTLVVAPDGRRGAAGTPRHPLATVREAVRRLPGGGVVEMRGGRYSQRIRLHRVRGITIRPYRHEHVVLDGSALTPRGTSAMVDVASSTHVVVERLGITGYATKRLGVVPIGIYVHGASSHITVRGNHVHAMGNYNPTLGSFDINAHGIAVYGDRPHHAITDLTIT